MSKPIMDFARQATIPVSDVTVGDFIGHQNMIIEVTDIILAPERGKDGLAYIKGIFYSLPNSHVYSGGLVTGIKMERSSRHVIEMGLAQGDPQSSATTMVDVYSPMGR